MRRRHATLTAFSSAFLVCASSMASDLKANAAPRQKKEGGEHGALHYAVDNASRQAQLQICQLRARRKVSSSTGDEYASCVCHVGSTEGVR